MLNLKNQFIFPPIKTGYSDGNGNITEKHLNFYKRRAKYLGAIIPEPLYMDKGLRELPTQIGIDNDDKIEGLKKLSDIAHSTDTKLIAHLNHPGRMANPKIPGNYFLSVSDIACENGGAKPKKMDINDIQNVKQLFVDSSIRAEKSGFDAIELQFGHGYLVAQFISPQLNNRDDQYGGSFDNRIRFALDILDAVKNAVQLPIIVRLSADEMIPNGIKIDEMLQFSKILEDKGADAIHISAGTVCSTPPWFFQHMFIPKRKTWEFAQKIRKEINIPVIGVGRINTFEDIENLKQNYNIDYYSVGRALVADPDFIGKYLGEIKGRAKPCMACSEGCLGGVRAGKGLGCVVNPYVGNDYETIPKAEISKNIAIVGGGISGMQAAILLNDKGHKTIIFEKDKLGGQFNLAYLPPKKDTLKKIVDYYIEEVKERNIEIKNQEAKKNDIINGNFDAVVIASGAKPAIPPIQGLKKYFWAEVLLDENLPAKKRVVVIGGGLIGIEIAHKLIQKENEVYIVEMLEEIARGMEMIEAKITLKNLRDYGVKIYNNTTVTAIDNDVVHIKGDFNEEILNVDHIIIATGMKSYKPLADLIKNDLPVYEIGDAKQVGKAQEAISSAYELAKNI